MDALSATEKIHSRLTADLEADCTSRPPAATAEETIDTDALTATTRLAADADDAPEDVEVIAPLDRWIGRYADVAMAWR
jgi:hypothetical protein